MWPWSTDPSTAERFLIQISPLWGERGESTMSAMKKLARKLVENYEEYVAMVYGPFDR